MTLCCMIAIENFIQQLAKTLAENYIIEFSQKYLNLNLFKKASPKYNAHASKN